ncbi:MAG: dihydrodipicolinate synthase family protein [SAR324 cluster bacterium]|nr:dihydrodipicolinate synthase family protein [SAR324 cluster bacterium]
MPLHKNQISQTILGTIKKGTVIPAHPLALDAQRKLDQRRQRALTRYYLDAGVGGIAVGVHTTQFEIREAGLYHRVLELAAETTDDWSDRPIARIAGLVGPTQQALAEARTAVTLGYHAGLLSLSAFQKASEDEMIEHCQQIANEIPLFGFYLQASVGGRLLSSSFWRRFAEIENVIAIKIAPFNRYHTLDVIHGIVAAGAENRITLYTGNDDHIVLDLILPFSCMRNGEEVQVRFKGGLLGHWSVWTAKVVSLFEKIQTFSANDQVDSKLLSLDSMITDCNSAFFDVANQFQGCIAGCHEVLRRQGLLEGIWCLDPKETLSKGQAEEIDRVYQAYPELNDDKFVRSNLERWLA